MRPSTPEDRVVELARALPPSLRLGCTGWTTPRWEGWVWEQPLSRGVLAREGLGAYAQHPLLRCVLVDGMAAARDSAALAALATSTPPDFRFVLAADQSLLWGRFPERFGEGPSSAENPLFLDAAEMTRRSIDPFVEGLGERAGALLIRIPSQDPRGLGTRRRFPERLHTFLRALPPGPRYAVELRDHKLLTAEYAAALRDCGVLHCLSLHPSMPALEAQLAVIEPAPEQPSVVCWSMCVHFDYRAATRNYAPYDMIVDRDPTARRALLSLLASSETETYVLVDNMAEGCAPASITELAEAIAQAR
ncbi:MAG: DUF72 domain-containing protein [Myxococcota bacterium]